MRFRHSRGFTLIELLVVISIIGMLSSVVLASVQAARDKGRVAAGLKFATYNYHALGVDMLGYWDFNTTVPCRPNPSAVRCVPDTAGLGIPLKPMLSYEDYDNPSETTVTNSYTSSNTPTRSGRSAKVNDAHFWGNSPNANTSKDLDASMDLKPKSFTLSAWVYLDEQPSNKEYVLSINNGVSGDLGAISVTFDSKFDCASNVHGHYNFVAGVAQVGRWHHVACSFDGDTSLGVMFVDGYEVARSVGEDWSELVYGEGPITAICIGFSINDTSNPFLGGNIDDVAIYSVPLVASDVHRLYLAGLPEHSVAQR